MPHDKKARKPSVNRRCRPRPLQVNLENFMMEDDDESETSECEIETTNSASTSSSGCNSIQTENALVYLRLRPVSKGRIAVYETMGNVLTTKNCPISNKSIVEKHFSFTQIMDGSVEQFELYDTCIRRSVEEEENITILSYGTSGSGKTHTQIGSADNPGLIPRALEHIFVLYENKVNEQPCINIVNSALKLLNDDEIKYHNDLREKMISGSNNEYMNHNRLKYLISNDHKFEASPIVNKSVFVWISYAEIYKEVVYDLLDPKYEQDISKKNGLRIVTNKGRVYIKNLTSIYVRNSFEAQLLLKLGSQRITFGSTAVNQNSSRSHCVFFIDVIIWSSPDIVNYHTYKFCDLAGTERQDKTKNTGNRLKEAQRINTSLLVLGRCLDAVYHNQMKKNADVVPYRDSKLTTLLQAPLLGLEKITMIVNLNPIDEYKEENLHVLNFASIAKNIVLKQKLKNEIKRSRYSWLAVHRPPNSSSTMNNDENYQLLQNEIKTLKDQNKMLVNEVIKLESTAISQEVELRKTLVEEYEEMLQKQDETWRKRFEQQKEFYEEKIRKMENEQKTKMSTSSIYITDSTSENESNDESLQTA